MTAPPEGPGPISSQNILEALAAALVSLSVWFMRKSGRQPRPTGLATQADIQKLNDALEGLRRSQELMGRDVQHISNMQASQENRIDRLEIARGFGAGAD